MPRPLSTCTAVMAGRRMRRPYAALRSRRSCPMAVFASRHKSRSPFCASRSICRDNRARISFISLCASSGSVLTNCQDFSNAEVTRSDSSGSRVMFWNAMLRFPSSRRSIPLGTDISRSALTVQREIGCCIAKRCCNAIRDKCCSAIRGNVTEVPRFEWLARRPVVRNHHTSSKFVQMQHSKPKRPNFHLSLGPCVNGKIALPGYLGTVSSTSRLGSSNAGGLHVRNLA
jgi:hypothetical protein